MNVGGSSLLNPAASINFDAQALQYDEELEYHREEQERQNELRALLTNASFELSDDDDNNSSLMSRSSSKDSGTNMDNQSLPTWHPPHTSWPLTTGHTSTPINTNPPPLTTPSTIQRSSTQTEGQDCTVQYPADEESSERHDNTVQYQPDVTLSNKPDTTANQFADNRVGYQQTEAPPAGEVIQQQYHQHQHNKEADVNYPNQEGPMPYPQPQMAIHPAEEHWGHPAHHMPPHGGQVQGHPQYVEMDMNGYYGYGPELPAYNYAEHMHPYHPYQHPQHHGYYQTAEVPQTHTADYRHHYEKPHHEEGITSPIQHVQAQIMSPPAQNNQAALTRRPSKSLSPDRNVENYKVRYGAQSNGQDVRRQNVRRSYESDASESNKKVKDDKITLQSGDSQTKHLQKSPNDQYVEMQKNFLEQEGNTDSLQLAQIQILYKARGRKIEELTSEIAALREETDREIRILKHNVMLCKDEKDGATVSLEQSKMLLQDSQSENAKLNGHISALQTEIVSLNTAKDQLIKKLQSAETTIESLSKQVMDLGSSDSLTRARDQHEAITSHLKQKHEQETLMLKEKLDAAHSNINDKDVNIDSLKKQILGLIKSSEEAQIDRANTINRLTRSLEDSQRQCRELLEAGQGHELSKVKLQVQEALASRSIAEDMCHALQEENSDLKEAIKMYESVSHLQSGDSANTSLVAEGVSDSFIHLGIKKKLDWSSMADNSMSEAGTQNSGDTVFTLKDELQRCLNQYKNKRQQVAQLKDQLKETRDKLSGMTEQWTELQTRHAQQQEEIQKMKVTVEAMTPNDSGLTAREIRLQKDYDNILRERDAVNEELMQLKQRLAEIAKSEEKATEMNTELRKQMAGLVQEFDEDKKAALQRCQRTCLQHHEDAKQEFQKQLKQQLVEEYEQTMKSVKDELEAAQTELYETKQLYVNVCQEKNELEEKLGKQWQEKMNQELIEMEKKCKKQTEEEIAELRLSLTSTAETKMVDARNKWTQELDQEVRRKVEAQVALAKVEWFTEHKETKETAISNAVKNSKYTLQAQMEADFESQIQEKIEEAKKQWKKDYEQTLNEELERKIKLEKDKFLNNDLADHLEKARKEWMETELREHIEEEQKKLRAEKQTAIEQALSDAKKDWELYHKGDLEKVKGECEKGHAELMEVALRKANEEWSKKHEDELEEKIRLNREQWEEERNRSLLEIQTNDQNIYLETVQQELETVKVERAKLYKELTSKKDQWLNERSDLINQKDKERKDALANVKESCEQDYQQILNEYKDTLNNELKRANDNWSTEKNNIIQQYETQIKDLEHKLQKLEVQKENLQKERHGIETEWNEKYSKLLKEVEEKKEEDTKIKVHKTMQTENLEQRESNDSSRQNSEDDEDEISQIWEKERNRLLRELQLRDKLLQSADAHLEAEIEKSHAELRQVHLKQMQKELDKAQAKFEKQLQHISEQNSQQRELLQKGVESAQMELDQIENDYKNRIAQLEELTASKEDEIERLMEDRDVQLQKLADKSRCEEDTLKKLVKQQAEFEKLERKYTYLTEALAKSEKEQNHIAESYKDRMSKLNAKLHHYEARIKDCEKRLSDADTQRKASQQQLLECESAAQRQMHILQQGLESEHKSAIENMKGKMVKLRQDYKNKTESLKTQYSSELSELRRQVNQYHEHQRAKTNTPTQTDTYDQDKTTMLDLKAQYVNAVSKIREEVLQYVGDMKKRSASKIKLAVQKQHNKTMQKTRQYYINYLQQVLKIDNLSMNKQQLIHVLQGTFLNLPEPNLSFQMPSSTHSSFSLTSSVTQSTDNSLISNSDRPTSHSNTFTVTASKEVTYGSSDLTLDLGGNISPALQTYHSLQNINDIGAAHSFNRRREDSPVHVTFAEPRRTVDIAGFPTPADTPETFGEYTQSGQHHRDYLTTYLNNNQSPSKRSSYEGGNVSSHSSSKRNSGTFNISSRSSSRRSNDNFDTSTPLELTPRDPEPQYRAPSAFRTPTKSYKYTSLLQKAKSASCGNLPQNTLSIASPNSDLELLNAKLQSAHKDVPRKYNPPSEKPHTNSDRSVKSVTFGGSPHITMRNKLSEVSSRSVQNLHLASHLGASYLTADETPLSHGKSHSRRKLKSTLN